MTRFASAQRRLTSGTERRLPPLRTLATGDVALATELVRDFAGRLVPDEVFDVWGDETARVAELVLARPPAKRRRLVRWWGIERARPGSEVLMALRSVRGVRGTWVVATAETTPHQAWADAGIWDWEVSLRLSPAERLDWVQRLLGGAPRHVAGQVVARVGTSPAHLLSATRALRVVVDAQPTTDDVAALVPADAGRDYVDALVAGDRRGAMAAAPLVPDAYAALQRLHWRLMDLWTLAELRPAASSRPAREVAEVTGLPRWAVDELVPLASRYPRAKVGDRLEALAVAHLGLRQAPDLPGQVLTTLAAMWTSGR